MHIVMIAAAANFGCPKWKMFGAPNQSASLTLLKLTRFMNDATIVPITRLSNTAIWLMKPLNTRLISRISRMTRPASAMRPTPPAPPVGSPVISEMSAPASDRPMMQMTVPATSGGKNRTTIENGLAMIRPNTPEISIAPYT